MAEILAPVDGQFFPSFTGFYTSQVGAGLQLLGGGSRSEVAVGCWEPLVKSLIRLVASKLGKADKKEAKETAMALDLGVSNLAPSGD